MEPRACWWRPRTQPRSRARSNGCWETKARAGRWANAPPPPRASGSARRAWSSGCWRCSARWRAVGERFRTRAMVVAHAVATRLKPRAARGEVRRVLIAHNLLLGDTLMLTPLLAKLRHTYPVAEITLLAAPSAVPLYERRPYGVRALAFRPADSSTTRALLAEPPFDLAFVIGDNRYSWLAAAMGARHVVAHSGDRPATKEWLVDEKRAYPSRPAAWSDMVADLADGPPPPPFARGDWEAPSARPFEKPAQPYAVLHVGGSTALKHWLPERWRALADALVKRGLAVAWSAGPGEE